VLTQLYAALFTATLDGFQFAHFLFAQWLGSMSESLWEITCNTGIAELHVTPAPSCLTGFCANLLFLTAPDGQHRRSGGASKMEASPHRDRLGLERSAGWRVRWTRRSLRSPLPITTNGRLRRPWITENKSRLYCWSDTGGIAQRIGPAKSECHLCPNWRSRLSTAGLALVAASIRAAAQADTGRCSQAVAG
jgi:hypothetical protein